LRVAVKASQDLPWFALRVKSNYEQAVAHALHCKEYEEFLPTYTARRRWSDRLKEVQRPLFAGYVFCRLDTNDRLPGLTTPGVVGIVGVGKTPLPIPTEDIEAVRTIVNSDLLVTPWPFLQVGQKVRIVQGPFTDVEGILLKFKTRWRLVVSIALLQRSVAVEIDGHWVEPSAPDCRYPLAQPA
jgi:transcription antitermination factor NusG